MGTNEHSKLLAGLEDALGYRFKRPEMLVQALTHRSWAVENRSASNTDNERLEFLGDAVLELAVSDLLFRKHAETHTEGDLTRMRAFLVNESQLASIASSVGLGSYIRLGRGERNSGGDSKPSLLSDALEAVIGAVYLDGGFHEALKLVSRLMGDLIDKAPKGLVRDFKSRLQELVQGRMHITPSYRVDSITGPHHCRTFNVSVLLDDKVISQGRGGSKKEAEQQAAGRALEILEQVKE